MNSRFRGGKKGQGRNDNNRNRQNYDYDQQYCGNYGEHDDRAQERRFNNNSNSKFRSNRSGRFNKNSRRRGGDQRFNSRNNIASAEDSFFKITIQNTNRFEQDYILNLLRENLDATTNIIFYNVRKEERNFVFYVNGSDAADTLASLNRRITTNNGYRLSILSKNAPFPTVTVDDKLIDMIKVVMSSLYDPNTNVMNLSKFHEAELFKSNGIFIPIYRLQIMKRILSIIRENTPNIVALNLSENRLASLDGFYELDGITTLKALDLSKNKISSKEELKKLQRFDLIELILEGNPVVESFPSFADYISECRKIFKSLRKLDNEDLPTEIGFDLGVQENIPETKPSYLPESMQTFVYEFLEAYYKIYDSDNRQPLIQAYHNDATFCLSVARNDGASNFRGPDAAFRASHNLLRLKDESLWVKNVKTSNIDIVSFLRTTPETKHDPASFVIDIPFFSTNFVMIVVNGLYSEVFKTNNPLRSFCRTFTIVPHPPGFVIANDILLISHPSSRQIQSHKSNKPNTQVNKMIPDVEFTPCTSINTNFGHNSSSSSLNQPSTSFGSKNQEILHKFMLLTNMNKDFSEKCLIENNYEPEKAFEVFKKLQSLNSIPPEAFIK